MTRLSLPLFLLALAPATVWAQTSPSLDLRGTFAPLHHESGLHMEPTRSEASGDMTAALRVSYAYQPLTLRDGSDEVRYAIVEHRFTGDMMLSIGLFDRLMLGLDLPLLLGQVGDEVRFDPAAERLVGTGRVPVAGLGDAGLRLKGTFIKPDLDELGLVSGFGLAADERFTLPSGDEQSFLGDGSITSETRLLFEYGAGPLTSQLRAGIRLRAEFADYACNPDASLQACDARFGHDVPLGVGFAFHPRALGIDPDGVATLFVEGRGRIPVAPVSIADGSAPSTFAASVAGRFRFGELALLAAIEAGIGDGIGTAPIGFSLGLSMAPRERDSDSDGIADDRDRCPDHPEDLDGFEDHDGCPEMDNDVDGIPDALDRCPLQPGSSAPDSDGCPAL